MVLLEPFMVSMKSGPIERNAFVLKINYFVILYFLRNNPDGLTYQALLTKIKDIPPTMRLYLGFTLEENSLYAILKALKDKKYIQDKILTSFPTQKTFILTDLGLYYVKVFYFICPQLDFDNFSQEDNMGNDEMAKK
jgi:hypothetical protein